MYNHGVWEDQRCDAAAAVKLCGNTLIELLNDLSLQIKKTSNLWQNLHGLIMVLNCIINYTWINPSLILR